MKLPWKYNEIHDIIVPRVPYLRNLPTILLKERDMSGDVYVICVKNDSQKSLKQAARVLGGYFKREGNYDFLPYELKFHEHTTIELVLLLKRQHDYAYHVMGCVEFDHDQQDSNIPKSWMLHWAWMHPYCRGKGYLSKVYPRLLERYGDFYFLAPVSKPMLHVVSKCGSDSQKALFEDQE